MQTAVIRYRVADFLKRYAPFDSLPEDDLLALAASGRVRFQESDEFVFEQGRAPGEFVWVIQQGRVTLITEANGREQLLDVLGEGDMLGLGRYAGQDRWTHTARTASDVILYAVNAQLFGELAAKHPGIERYLAAHFSAADTDGFGRTSWLDAEAPPIDFLRARTAAIPTGLPAVPAPLSTRTAVRAMLDANTDAVTTDGALLTASDLALFCGANPTRLAAAIREARSEAEISTLLRLSHSTVVSALAGPHDVPDCCRIGSAILRETAGTAIRVAAKGAEPPPVPHCWIMFGAAARGDLLRPTAPSLAVLYDDAHPAAGLWFTTLARETAALLRGVGLEDVQSMPFSHWRAFYSETIRDPITYGLYSRREFFDLHHLSADSPLVHEVQEHIISELARDDSAVSIMAIDSLSRIPPLTFLDGKVLGPDGEQQETFDIAETITTPIADAARVFALGKRRISSVNTFERLAAAAGDFPASSDVFREAADAFSAGLFYQTLANSTCISPSRLRRYDQRLIKTALASVERLLQLTIATFIRKS
jgi:signal-transduction protein with cAMP-binding, CBS, and nucleotidyltransferase domain